MSIANVAPTTDIERQWFMLEEALEQLRQELYDGFTQLTPAGVVSIINNIRIDYSCHQTWQLPPALRRLFIEAKARCMGDLINYATKSLITSLDRASRKLSEC